MPRPGLLPASSIAQFGSGTGHAGQQGAARRLAGCCAEQPSHLRLMLARLAALVLGIDSPRISAISSSSPVRGT